MTKNELDAVAYAVRSKRKKKGKNKGYKYTYTTVWSGRVSRGEYASILRENDPREYGFFLCKLERFDFTEDRWWDTPSYREEAIRSYRDKIKSIRMLYGLSKSEVAEFMRVG